MQVCNNFVIVCVLSLLNFYHINFGRGGEHAIKQVCRMHLFRLINFVILRFFAILLLNYFCEF